MTITDQVDAMKDTLTTLKEVLPQAEGEHFTNWVRRGMNEGMLTHDEAETLTRIFVYGGAETLTQVLAGA
jgi:hypothetical protein